MEAMKADDASERNVLEHDSVHVLLPCCSSQPNSPQSKMQRIMIPRRRWLVAVGLLFMVGSHAAEPSVTGTIDGIVARMQTALGPEMLLQLDERAVQQFITRQDRQVLATQYWHFDVNVPVVVSVMRDVNQVELPFWLPQAGFHKTDLRVAN